MSTTVTEARNIIRDAFIVYRDANFSGMKTAWENVPFNPPANLDEYMRVSIVHSTGTRPSLGINHTRRAGILFVQIYTKINKDMRRSDTLSQSVLDFLRVWPPSVVRIREPSLAEVGPDDAWFQVNVSATFEYDDFG